MESRAQVLKIRPGVEFAGLHVATRRLEAAVRSSAARVNESAMVAAEDGGDAVAGTHATGGTAGTDLVAPAGIASEMGAAAGTEFVASAGCAAGRDLAACVDRAVVDTAFDGTGQGNGGATTGNGTTGRAVAVAAAAVAATTAASGPDLARMSAAA